MKSNNKSLEDFVRDSLKNQEYPYDNNEWLKLEKKLPASSAGSTIFKAILSTIVVITAITVSIFGYLHFNSGDSTKICNFISNTPLSDNNTTLINSDSTASQRLLNNSDGKEDKVEKNQDYADYSSINYLLVDTEKTIPFIVADKISETYSDPAPSSILKQTPQLQDANQNLPDPSFDLVKNEGCAPFSISATPMSISDSLVYFWNFGNNASSSEVSAQYTYEKPGVYEITLQVRNKNNSKLQSKLSKTIIVKQPAMAKFEYNNMENLQFAFSNLSVNAETYLWNFGDAKTSTEKNPIHSFDSDGEYAVQLLATNNNGCKDVIEMLVTVKMEHTLYMPNTFSPNGDGINDFFGPNATDLTDDGYSLIIYDKNGSIIFESHSLSRMWDGMNAKTNKKATEGVFVYKVIVKTTAGKVIEKTGPVLILY